MRKKFKNSIKINYKNKKKSYKQRVRIMGNSYGKNKITKKYKLIKKKINKNQF